MISATGWIVPTSLLARPIETNAAEEGTASGPAWPNPSTFATSTRWRARSSAARAARPSAWGLDGLPSGRSRSAAWTSGRTGAEPASSRKMRRPPRSAAAVIRLVDELGERALEVLQIHVKVEDLVNRDRLGRPARPRFGNRLLDLLD